MFIPVPEKRVKEAIEEQMETKNMSSFIERKS